MSVAASSIAPSLTDASACRDIWSHTDAHGVISGGMLRISALASHDSVFYRFSTAKLLPVLAWWSTLRMTTVHGHTNRSTTERALAACERVRDAGDCASLTPCEQRCAALAYR